MSMQRPASTLRIGDAERDRAIDALREHFAAGRLTKLEHEERTELALQARTGADLDVLFADLPLLETPLLETPFLERPGGGDVARRRRPRTLRPVPQVVVAALAAMLALFAIVQLIPVIAAVLVFFFVTRLAFGHHCVRRTAHLRTGHLARGYVSARRW